VAHPGLCSAEETDTTQWSVAPLPRALHPDLDIWPRGALTDSGTLFLAHIRTEGTQPLPPLYSPLKSPPKFYSSKGFIAPLAQALLEKFREIVSFRVDFSNLFHLRLFLSILPTYATYHRLFLSILPTYATYHGQSIESISFMVAVEPV
jgi:hypothetical protein